ncbi:hypothetical protein NC651_007122 [Populus alba x Populus x berolinensis]|nr:hypothetical protein NC651_007122 [Populus alba x Populus x berolinensis]
MNRSPEGLLLVIYITMKSLREDAVHNLVCLMIDCHHTVQILLSI